jgi:hypothetical protein
MLKQALQSNDYRLAVSGGVIYELVLLLSTSFTFTSGVYVPRTCNRVAHALAAAGCKCAPNEPIVMESTFPLKKRKKLLCENVNRIGMLL